MVLYSSSYCKEELRNESGINNNEKESWRSYKKD